MTEDNKQDTSFPSGGSRTEYIGAKVTVEQKQYIRRLAAECGMTVSSYVLARLRAGKSFQLQAESEADGKAGGGHGDPYRMPQRPRELHVRAPWHEPRKAQTDV